MTWMSSLIISSSVIVKMDFSKYLHFASLFNYFGGETPNVYWLPDFVPCSIPDGCNYKGRFSRYVGKDCFTIIDDLEGV